MLSKVDALNEKIKKGEIAPKDLMVGSLDVESLYPSIDTKVAAKVCRDRVKNSKLSFLGIDYQWALLYLSVTMSPAEIVDAKLQGVLPRRNNKQGRKSTINTTSTMTTDDLQKWWYPKPPTLLTAEEKQMIMGCIVKLLVKIVLEHMSTCGMIIYHQ